LQELIYSGQLNTCNYSFHTFKVVISILTIIPPKYLWLYFSFIYNMWLRKWYKNIKCTCCSMFLHHCLITWQNENTMKIGIECWTNFFFFILITLITTLCQSSLHVTEIRDVLQNVNSLIQDWRSPEIFM
jgi:hypothetical protein